MFKMIIADDDPLVIETLCSVVDWGRYGIEIAATATNGSRALDLCRELLPDILFTDIMMPEMSGLEVSLALREEGFDTKIIIISGVQDFHYARTALEARVEGYVLKPIRVEELQNVAQKTVSSLRMERNHDEVMNHMRGLMQESHAVMKAAFLRNLVAGAYFGEKHIEEKLNFFDVPLRYAQSVCVAVLKLDDYLRLIDNQSEADRQLFCTSVLSVAQEILDINQAGIILSMKDNEYALLLLQAKDRGVTHEDVLKEIQDRIRLLLHVSASVGIGNHAAHLGELKYAYENALQALRHRFFYGPESMISITDVLSAPEFEKLEHASKFAQQYRLLDELTKLLRGGATERCLQCVDALFHLLAQTRIFSVEYVRSLCLEQAGVLCRMHIELEEQSEKNYSLTQKNIEQIIRAETIVTLKEIFRKMMASYCESYNTIHSSRHETLVKEIEAIIEKKYMENLTLNSIADEVFMTKNYICLVFKKEKGITINTYLTNVRVENAVRLLRDTRLKIWQISEQVGYDNAHYFSTVFKKVTGMQPQQFRSIDIENE